MEPGGGVFVTTVRIARPEDGVTVYGWKPLGGSVLTPVLTPLYS
jgi:hypothetical protein